MKLYLVQHGLAQAKETDPDRPLTDEGKKDIDNLASFLQKAEINPDRVIHSGKLRARQTADILAGRLSPGLAVEISGLINPNDDPGLRRIRSKKLRGGPQALSALPEAGRAYRFPVFTPIRK